MAEKNFKYYYNIFNIIVSLLGIAIWIFIYQYTPLNRWTFLNSSCPAPNLLDVAHTNIQPHRYFYWKIYKSDDQQVLQFDVYQDSKLIQIMEIHDVAYSFDTGELYLVNQTISIKNTLDAEALNLATDSKAIYKFGLNQMVVFEQSGNIRRFYFKSPTSYFKLLIMLFLSSKYSMRCCTKLMRRRRKHFDSLLYDYLNVCDLAYLIIIAINYCNFSNSYAVNIFLFNLVMVFVKIGSCSMQNQQFSVKQYLLFLLFQIGISLSLGMSAALLAYSCLPFIQIVNNMVKNRRRVFKKQSWILYFENIIYMLLSDNKVCIYYIFERREGIVYILSFTIIAISITIMKLQEFYGPFLHLEFLRKKFIRKDAIVLWEVEETDKNISDDVCSICLSDLRTINIHETAVIRKEEVFNLIKTPCNHYFHENCLKQWTKYQKLCPLDKKPLPEILNTNYWC